MQNGFWEGVWDVLIRDKETQVHMRAPATSSGNSIWVRWGVLQGSREGDGLRSASEGHYCGEIAKVASGARIPPHQGYLWSSSTG